MSTYIGTDYLRRAFTLGPMRLIADMTNAIPDDLDYDTIAGTGLSGTVFACRVTDILKKNLCIVRKPNVSSHSDLTVEGTLGHRVLLVDDFTSSGATLARMVRTLRKHWWNLTIVGLYEYGANEFDDSCRYRTAEELADRYDLHDELGTSQLADQPWTEDQMWAHLGTRQGRTEPVGGWASWGVLEPEPYQPVSLPDETPTEFWRTQEKFSIPQRFMAGMADETGIFTPQIVKSLADKIDEMTKNGAA